MRKNKEMRAWKEKIEPVAPLSFTLLFIFPTQQQ